MATTTASLTINSGDLTSDVLNLSTSQTLYDSAGTTGPTLTSGLVRVNGFGSEGVLVANGSYGGNAYVYIKNTDSTYTNSCEISIGTNSMGDLYGGQFMFIPWDTEVDIEAHNVSASTVLEYIVIHTA